MTFDKEFKELYESCKGQINPFHDGSILRLMGKKYDSLTAEESAHEEACYHLKAGLVTTLLRELDKLKLPKNEEVLLIHNILERFIAEHVSSRNTSIINAKPEEFYSGLP